MRNHLLLALAVAGLIGGGAAVAAPAKVQSYSSNYFKEQAHWTGTWRTGFGEVKLRKGGTRLDPRLIYGQYGNDDWLVGWTSARGRIMRGFFQRTGGAKPFGVFEWHMDPSGRAFRGGWRWNFDPAKTPDAVSGTWNGIAVSPAEPTVANVPQLVQQGVASLPVSDTAIRNVFNKWTHFDGTGANSFLEYLGAKPLDEVQFRLLRVAPYRYDANPGIFGIAGVYLSCTGGAPLAPKAGTNRLFDVAQNKAHPRFEYARNAPKVTFALPKHCIAANKGLVIQLQTNLQERDPFRNDRLGYQAVAIGAAQISDFHQQMAVGVGPTNNLCRNRRMPAGGWLFDCYVLGGGEIANVQFEMTVR